MSLNDNVIADKLYQYIKEIETFNDAYGLVKIENRDELIIKHILDSLAPVKILSGLLEKCRSTGSGSESMEGNTGGSAGSSMCNSTGRIADLGSGAGLPGIPLAICMPSTNFTLIERMGRRAGFLRNTQAVLGLKNIYIEETDLKELKSGEKFDIIVFRAFKPLEKNLLRDMQKILSPHGYLAAYKGKRDSLEAELSNLTSTQASGSGSKILPQFSWEVLPLNVPFLNDERHLLIVHSIKI